MVMLDGADCGSAITLMARAETPGRHTNGTHLPLPFMRRRRHLAMAPPVASVILEIARLYRARDYHSSDSSSSSSLLEIASLTSRSEYITRKRILSFWRVSRVS